MPEADRQNVAKQRGRQGQVRQGTEERHLLTSHVLFMSGAFKRNLQQGKASGEAHNSRE
jgi:hypothetical protein